MSDLYRTAQIVPDKPKMGLIPAKKKPHRCVLPYIGWFHEILFWRPAPKEGALFRCFCGKVHRVKLDEIYGNDSYGSYKAGSQLIWEECPIEVWLEAGGKE